MYNSELLKKIYQARAKSSCFFNNVLLRKDIGWLYTSTHDYEKYPSAILYGTWSGILGINLIKEITEWKDEQKFWALQKLNQHRRADGAFLPIGLEKTPTSKSLEYLKLHCTNYSLGAALEIDPQYDFESKYMNRFLDGDYLGYWLDARSLQRPWEEGNNIVNVSSYLALMNDAGNLVAQARLAQMMDWHRKKQNPKTGGFDSFESPSYNQRLETLAGAVHNYHLHLYVGEKFGCEDKIIPWVEKFMYQGNLSACLSIDFVELAVRTILSADNPQPLVNALIYHAEELLATQRSDGGWAENGDQSPTIAAGFVDKQVSSCSYATWFKLASLGMISICLLGDAPKNWSFRKTLGMGYSPKDFPDLSTSVMINPTPITQKIQISYGMAGRIIKSSLIRLGTRIIK